MLLQPSINLLTRLSYSSFVLDNSHLTKRNDLLSQASNIDGCMQQVSRGELQLTEKDLIYFRRAKEPIRWPLEYIRRYGYNDGDGIFYLESGRRSKTGEAIFAFRVDCGEDLVNRLKEKIDKSPSMNSLPRSELCRLTNAIGQKVPKSPSSEDGSRRDAYTSTTTDGSEKSTADTTTNQLQSGPSESGAHPEGLSNPLSYTSIDFDTTKALNESAQAHAANRVK